jgi:hypothetical protein
MKRVLLASGIAVILILSAVGVALAHGSAYMSGGFSIASGVIRATGTYNVSESHSFIFASATLFRRQPGGTWSQLSYDNSTGSGRAVTATTAGVTLDCRKDYKYELRGYSGATSAHAFASKTGTRLHTC